MIRLIDGPAKLIPVGAALLLTWLFGQSQGVNLVQPGETVANVYILCCVFYAVLIFSSIWRMGRAAREPQPRFRPAVRP